MRALLTLVAVSGVLAVAVPGAVAADECRGLMVCIPVEGPWVIVGAPGPGSRYPASSWQLRCPEGVVAGLDARLTDTAVDIGFTGRLGSPVNPGITTRDAVVFTGRYTGLDRRPTAFKPFIGCIPAAGGQRTPTAVSPGEPTILRVRTVRFQPGAQTRIVHGCRPGERLVSATHALALLPKREPTVAELAAVRSSRIVRDRRIVVTATRKGLPARIGAKIQVHALCTRSGPQA